MGRGCVGVRPRLSESFLAQVATNEALLHELGNPAVSFFLTGCENAFQHETRRGLRTRGERYRIRGRDPSAPLWCYKRPS
jgi:hypothetical protein